MLWGRFRYESTCPAQHHTYQFFTCGLAVVIDSVFDLIGSSHGGILRLLVL